MTIVTFLLILGLSLRLTRLVVDDTIVDPAKRRILLTLTGWNKSGIAGWLEQLWSCRWCTGVWASAGSVALYAAAPTFFFWVAVAASVSYLVGIVSLVEYWLNGE